MLNLKKIEFYGTSSGEVIIHGDEFGLKRYETEDCEFTEGMLEKIVEFYPEAFGALAHASKTRMFEGSKQ